MRKVQRSQGVNPKNLNDFKIPQENRLCRLELKGQLFGIEMSLEDDQLILAVKIHKCVMDQYENIHYAASDLCRRVNHAINDDSGE